MVELIISEKPSAAKKIAEALADGKPIQKKNGQSTYYELSHGKKDIIVTSAVGHLYGLTEIKKKNYDYPVYDIEWEASYKHSKNRNYIKTYISTISKLAKTADEFTIACDFDVEGEVIGWNVIRFACKQKDANRMKFSTLTKPDLIEAYEKKLNHLDWGQALAGETRHKLDWFYGINVSRALTATVKAAGAFKVMSAGRVQGPALKLLVDREREIAAFKPEPFWQIKFDGECQDAKKEMIEAWHKGDKIFDKKEAERIMSVVKGEKEATVAEIKRNKRNQAPPYPFDLTTLQSESYGLFKITPKDTLATAQSLYLAGVTSYPRTSSQKLDPKLGFQKILTQLSKQPVYENMAKELLKLPVLKPNDGKKTDPAHPAIYPTGVVPKKLNPYEAKIYDLVVKRFFATFGKAAVRESMIVNLDVKNEIFTTKGTRTLEENWHLFYKPYVKLEEVTLPDLKQDDKVSVKKFEKQDKETQPPNRFNQSSIIKELEKRKLGTKATRADILDRLFQRGYVEGVKITATQLGIETVTMLEKHSPIIVDEKLTAEFEEDMQKIREGKEKQEAVLERAKKILNKLMGHFKKNEKKIGVEILESIRETIQAAHYMGHCPKCKDGNLSLRKGKYGRFAACDKYPDCKTTFHLPKVAFIKYTGKQCEACNHPMIEAGVGRSKRINCLNPDCPTKRAEGEADAIAKNKKVFPEQDMLCPTCKEGKMILRKSFYGEFLGCDNYPKCMTMMKIKDGKVDVEHPVVKDPSKKKVAKKKKTTKKKTVKKKVAKKK